MRCPQCGKENPDGARYCDSCLSNLEILRKDYSPPEEQGMQGAPQPPTMPYYQPPQGTSSTYHSPSEWREVAPRQAARRPPTKAGRRIGGIKLDWAIYGSITVAIVLTLILMVLVWGNPTPAEVANGFMSALSRKDVQAMRKYIYSPTPADEAKMNEMVGRIGEGGGFSGLKYRVTETDQYYAVAYIIGGTYNPGGAGFTTEIDEDKRLSLSLENHEGHWYVNLTSSRVFP
jgi:hypothetical protein